MLLIHICDNIKMPVCVIMGKSYKMYKIIEVNIHVPTWNICFIFINRWNRFYNNKTCITTLMHIDNVQQRAPTCTNVNQRAPTRLVQIGAKPTSGEHFQGYFAELAHSTLRIWIILQLFFSSSNIKMKD